MSTFALVHGVCVGARSWDLVRPYLEDGGHRVVAIDLPGDRPEPAFSDYAAVVVDALSGVDDDLVLVGHSTGGLTIPLVPSQRPVRELVFVCAALPVPGKSVAERGVEWQVVEPGEWQVYRDDGSFTISAEGFRRHVAPDAPAQVVEAAIALLRPQFLAPFLEPCPLDAMPNVPCRSILCRDDRIVGPDYSRRAARDLLGIGTIELPGGHSPMASRPAQLADALLGSAVL